MEFRWAQGSRQSGDPNVVGQALHQIQRRHGGQLLPADVVESAKPKNSPLHRYFEWDDSKAAVEYRLTQARLLIRTVVVMPDPKHKDPPIIRAFVHVDDDERHYQDIHTAMSHEQTREQILARALKEAESWARRWKDLEEFAEIFRAVDAAKVKVARKPKSKKPKLAKVTSP